MKTAALLRVAGQRRGCPLTSTWPTLIVGLACLTMLPACAHDFAVRRVDPLRTADLAGVPATTRTTPDRPVPGIGTTTMMQRGVEAQRGGRPLEAAGCYLQALEELDARPTAARRFATARLVETCAPALLARPGEALSVAGPSRRYLVRLRPARGLGGMEPERFVGLEPADRFAVSRVPAFSESAGVGAPLVGSLHPLAPVHRGSEPGQRVGGLHWAVTAVAVFGDRAGPVRPVTLELHDPHTTGRTAAGAGPQASQATLAADYTTPLAVTAAEQRRRGRGLLGFVRGDVLLSATGLYPVERPTPTKTPLVLIHGLISDPNDFRYLLNALNGDPEVRRRYQVWVFYYPTSLPVPYSAMVMREDLEAFIRHLDPAGTHPAMHRTVLVAHSMGGVLGRLAISDGGDVYYRHFFRQPVEELKLSPANRALVRRVFFYRASPDVAQVVFVATPHRGSKLAGGPLGNLGRLLVRVPRTVRESIRDILSNNPTALATGAPLKPASSLDSLSPRDPLVAAVNDMPMCTGVGLHSVLGDRGRGGPPERSSDGVVPYASSHLPQAGSEIIVPAGHTGILRRPETAGEIIRVLQWRSGAL